VLIFSHLLLTSTPIFLMADRVRYTSVPPGGAAGAADAAATTMVNPSYSSTIISASEVGSVTTTEPTCESVEIELAPFAKRIISEPKNIKMILLSLIGLVAFLLLLNLIFICILVSAPSLHNEVIYQELSVGENETIPTTNIPASTTPDVPSTTLEVFTPATVFQASIIPLSTIPTPTVNVSDETLTREYNYFTRRFNRPKSDAGLRNFAENYATFTASEDGINVAETQFADLSLTEMKKIINADRDSSRSESRFTCRLTADFLQSDSMSYIFKLHSTSRIPARFDLRRNVKMPKVFNQGTSCNSGYAFAAIAQVDYIAESSLSVQSLLCDIHNSHCQGGIPFKARQTVTSIGIPLEKELPFSEKEKWCDDKYDLTKVSDTPCFLHGITYYHTNKTLEHPVTVTVLISVILTRHAPVIVEVPVDRRFFFHKGGIYRPKCDEIIGYQPVIVVGYEKKDGGCLDFAQFLRSRVGD
ncbi:hypothetical protein PMAYCL1PPCAC_31103, partial [Pristionchus mayeri]